MDLGLLQKELARTLGVDEMTVVYWELNQRTPQVGHWPLIVDFLGYYPGPIGTLSDRILGTQRCLGLNQEALASKLGIDPATIKRARQGRRCIVDVVGLLDSYLSQLVYCTKTKCWIAKLPTTKEEA